MRPHGWGTRCRGGDLGSWRGWEGGSLREGPHLRIEIWGTRRRGGDRGVVAGRGEGGSLREYPHLRIEIWGTRRRGGDRGVVAGRGEGGSLCEGPHLRIEIWGTRRRGGDRGSWWGGGGRFASRRPTHAMRPHGWGTRHPGRGGWENPCPRSGTWGTRYRGGRNLIPTLGGLAEGVYTSRSDRCPRRTPVRQDVRC